MATSSIREQIIARLQDKNKIGQESIEKAQVDMLSRYPLDKFKEYFLPMFSGEIQQDAVLMNQWLQIAGEYTRAVNLVDDNGNIVDQVPPLNSTDIFNHTPSRTSSFSGDLSLISRGLVSNPDEYVYTKGLQLLNDLQSPDKIKALQQRWVDFIARMKPQSQLQAGADVDDLYDY